MRAEGMSLVVAAWMVTGLGASVSAGEAEEPEQVRGAKDVGDWKPGRVLRLGELDVTVREFDTTPVVRNHVSRRFRFDQYDNPKLRKLRRQEKLGRVVAAGKDEFDRQVRLMDWVHHRFKKFGRPSSDPQGALEIFDAVDRGGRFYCAHYATALVSCAASLGWIDRPIGLRVGRKAHGSGSTEHSVTEMWSNQHNKWVLFDPTYALYVEKDGRPLSGWELRQEWFYGDRAALDFVIGKERKRYKTEEMPIFRAHHPGYGDLSLKPRTIDKLAFMFFVPNTDRMDSEPGYGRGVILKDAEQCEGVKWHRRENPAPGEVYFPLNQVDLSLSPGEGEPAVLKVAVDTMTPNFAGYRHRIDGGPWRHGAPETWTLHEGRNALEVIAVNRWGVEGHPSEVVLEAERQLGEAGAAMQAPAAE